MSAFIGYIKKIVFIGQGNNLVPESYLATDYNTGELKYPGVIINFSGDEYFLDDSVAP